MADFGAKLGDDDLSGFISCPSSDRYNFGKGDFTCTALVMTSGGGSVLSRIGLVADQLTGWTLRLDSGGVLRFHMAGGGEAVTYSSLPTGALDGYWHHIAAVRQEGVVSLYLDGVALLVHYEGSSNTLDVSNGFELLMGGIPDARGQTPALPGLIEDVTLWNRSLSQAELSVTRYNQLIGTETGLVGFWPMNNNLNDESLTHNTGRIEGSVTFVQIFHCDPVSGRDDYAFARISNAFDGEAARESALGASVTRSQAFQVLPGTPALIGGLITGLEDFAFPAGANLSITDPTGHVYSQARADETAYVQMDGDSVRLIAVQNPLPGTWLIKITAPGSLAFEVIVQTVPSSEIPGTIEASLQPVYGTITRVLRGPAGSSISRMFWVVVGTAVIALGLFALTGPIVAGTALAAGLAIVVNLPSPVVEFAARAIPADQGAAAFIDTAANMIQLDPPKDRPLVVFADALCDDATRVLFNNKVEMYSALATQGRLGRGQACRRDKFTTADISSALQGDGVRYLVATCHGLEDAMIGLGSDGKCDNAVRVLGVGSYPPQAVRGKIIHLCACRCGAALGLDLIRNGALAFFGYTRPWAFMPAFALDFALADSVIDLRLAEGNTTGEAHTACITWMQDKIARFQLGGEGAAAFAGPGTVLKCSPLSNSITSNRALEITAGPGSTRPGAKYQVTAESTAADSTEIALDQTSWSYPRSRDPRLQGERGDTIAGADFEAIVATQMKNNLDMLVGPNIPGYGDPSARLF